jgi:hypothetical protein
MIIPAIIGAVATAASTYATWKQQQQAQQNQIQQQMRQQQLGMMQNAEQGSQIAEQQRNSYAAQAEQQRLARQQYELATSGTTNARGDRTRYVPGVGWVEELSDESQVMQGLSDTETRRRLAEDMPRSRFGREMNFDTRLQEREAADTKLRQFQEVQGRSPAAIEAAMLEQNMANAQDPIDATRQQVQMNALRGNSGASDILAALSERGAQGTRSAIAQARADAPTAALEENAGRQNNTLNQYNTLATRASNIDDVAFQPENLPNELASRGQIQANNAPRAIEGASSATYRGSAPLVDAPTFRSWNSPSIDYSGGPNTGMALAAAGQTGENLYNAFADRQASKPKNWKANATGSGGSSGGGGTSSVRW